MAWCHQATNHNLVQLIESSHQPSPGGIITNFTAFFNSIATHDVLCDGKYHINCKFMAPKGTMLCHLLNFYGMFLGDDGFLTKDSSIFDLCNLWYHFKFKSWINTTKMKTILKLEESIIYIHTAPLCRKSELVVLIIIVLDNRVFLVSATNHYSKHTKLFSFNPRAAGNEMHGYI